jgi:quinol monooxygenase YgiN
MSFMLKLRWDIKEGQEADFKANQEKLCEVMLEHPGVISYHAEYPSPGVSEWTEIYANDAAFKAHLDNEKGQAPLGAIIEACDKITCRCFGDPNDESKEILAGFGATYPETAPQAFVLNPRADKDSMV